MTTNAQPIIEVRDLAKSYDSGEIAVYFDNMDEPVMTAKDKSFAWGTVGVGTFDDTANFDNVVLRGTQVERRK